jgi:hypothetical protein
MSISRDSRGVWDERFCALEALFEPTPPTREIVEHSLASRPLDLMLPTADGIEDINLLGDLLSFADPVIDAEDRTACDAAAESGRCVFCSPSVSRRNCKRRRCSVDGATSKVKSQSQRQREEIARLKQEIEGLSTKLVVLKHRQARSSSVDEEQQHDSALEAPTIDDHAEQSWEKVAKRRRLERSITEAEHLSLRKAVERQWQALRVLVAQLSQ